ncbi:MAG: DUF2185 domain-containing protein [Acidobacteriota bacterium]
MKKVPRIDESAMERMIPHLGGCMVSDAVAVSDGEIGSMVREEPLQPGDSGWIFTAGTESPEELNDAGRYSILEVNTVANRSPDIIPFLLLPPGSEVRRNPDGRLTLARGSEGPPPVQLLAAAKPGWVQLTESWGFDISSRLLRRLENGSQVLWRPGLTIWIDVYRDETVRPAEERLEQILRDVAPQHYAQEVVRDGGDLRFRYRLEEEGDDGSRRSACYCFALSDQEELHIAFFFESDELPSDVERIWSSIRRRPLSA